MDREPLPPSDDRHSWNSHRATQQAILNARPIPSGEPSATNSDPVSDLR